MKKYGMLVFTMALVCNFTVSAQDSIPPQVQKGHRKEFRQGEKPMISAEKRAEKMAKELDLSTAQKLKVQALFEKQDSKRKEQIEKGEKIKAEMKSKFEIERKANDEEMTKIIGPEKFKKLQDLRTEKMGKMKERHEKHVDMHPENLTPKAVPAN